MKRLYLVFLKNNTHRLHFIYMWEIECSYLQHKTEQSRSKYTSNGFNIPIDSPTKSNSECQIWNLKSYASSNIWVYPSVDLKFLNEHTSQVNVLDLYCVPNPESNFLRLELTNPSPRVIKYTCYYMNLVY